MWFVLFHKRGISKVKKNANTFLDPTKIDKIINDVVI